METQSDSPVITTDNTIAVAVAPEVGVTQTVPVGIPYPPGHIFKFDLNRVNPANEVWQNSVTYIPERAEYIEGVGNFVFYHGVPYPSKTVAPPQAISAVNGVKRLFLSSLRLVTSKQAIVPILSLFLMGRKRRGILLTNALKGFNDTSNMIVSPFRLVDGSYCKLVKELRAFIDELLVSFGVDREVAHETSEYIGMMFEYDNAYRYRIQDVLNEADPDRLVRDFPTEAKRLILLQESREVIGKEYGVTGKFQSGVRALNYLWYVPSLKKALKRAIGFMRFENVQLDASDIYHTLLYNDYNTMGRTLPERFQVYAQIHGPDTTKWPPKMMVSNRAPTPEELAAINKTSSDAMESAHLIQPA